MLSVTRADIKKPNVKYCWNPEQKVKNKAISQKIVLLVTVGKAQVYILKQQWLNSIQLFQFQGPGIGPKQTLMCHYKQSCFLLRPRQE